jgi:hypothetical protein
MGCIKTFETHYYPGLDHFCINFSISIDRSTFICIIGETNPPKGYNLRTQCTFLLSLSLLLIILFPSLL